MFIEKSESKEELIDNINIIIKSTKDKKKLEKIASIVSYLLDNVLEEEIQEELLEKIERKVGDKSMSTLYDRLLAENRRLIKQGKVEGKKEIKKEIAQNMLNKKLDEQIILETIGIEKEELEKIKAKLKIAG